MQVTALTSAFMPALFEFWYDLEVLRAQLFRLTSPTNDATTWSATQTAWLGQKGVVGFVCQDETALGAIAVMLNKPYADVWWFVVDLHMSQRRAVGKLLWDALKKDLLSRSVTHVRASAKHNLPVEAAFWQANKATRKDTYWEVFL